MVLVRFIVLQFTHACTYDTMQLSVSRIFTTQNKSFFYTESKRSRTRSERSCVIFL